MSADATEPIRLVAYTDTTGFGGAEKVLGHVLAELPPSFEVVVMGVDEAIVSAIAGRRPGTGTLLVPAASGKWRRRAIAAHIRAVRHLEADVFHGNLWMPWTCQYVLLAAVLADVPAIAVEHAPIPSHSPLQRAFKRRLSSRLAAHVAVGDHAARLVEEYAGLPAGSVRTIYNGVPRHPGRLVRDPAAPGPVIGSLGRLDAQKGYDVLLRALAQLRGVRLVLVGDGEEREPLESLAESLGVADRVELTGWRQDARSYLGTFDVFVLPSRYEGFPLSIIEAMLAGLPVVASDVGSVAEAVVHGETGLLVEPEEPEPLAVAIQSALEPDVGAALGAAGRARAEELFTLERMVASYEILYREVARAG